MKKVLPTILLLAFIFNFILPWKAYSQLTFPKESFEVKVSAKLGEFFLNLSGWISPFASVVLTSDGSFLRATVADNGGNFSISQVLIKRGFSNFCLEAVDYKRLGESVTCFNIKPAVASVEMKEIFLPPTLGLSRNEIAEGAETTAFGYTMPGAYVTLYLSNGKVLSGFADNSGYYEFKVKNLKAGVYELYSRAEYQNKESLAPSKKVKLTALSWWEQLLAFIRNLFKKLWALLTSIGLGPLWIAIPILILIIILILKLWPEKFSFIYENKLMYIFTKWLRPPKKRLHHYWMFGY